MWYNDLFELSLKYLFMKAVRIIQSIQRRNMPEYRQNIYSVNTKNRKKKKLKQCVFVRNLFKRYKAAVLIQLRIRLGFILCGQNLSNTRYADDTVLMGFTTDTLMICFTDFRISKTK